MAAFGGNRHALIIFSTEIDIPQIIKKAYSLQWGIPGIKMNNYII